MNSNGSSGSRSTRALAVLMVVGVGFTGAAVAAALGDGGQSGSAGMTAIAPASSTAAATDASTDAVTTDDINQGAPVNTDAPDYDGVLEVGQQLTADPGTWDNGPVHVAFQWFSCDPLGFSCPNIPGATQASYTVAPSDAGDFVGVEVVATNAIGDSPPADSIIYGPVPQAVPANQAAPVVTGAPQVGGTLSTDTGTWSNEPLDYSYQWYSCDPGSPDSCQPIANANDPAYAPTSDDVGQSLAVGVSATNDGGTGDEAMSQLTGAVG